MRHSYFGRKLSRTKNERRRLFSGLIRDLLLHGKITTTTAKAKAVRPMIEKIITRAKRGGEGDKRLVAKVLGERKYVELMVAAAASRFSKRTSGYTRMIHLGTRMGDNAEKVLLSFVDAETALVPVEDKKSAVPEKKTVQKPVIKEKKTPAVKKKK